MRATILARSAGRCEACGTALAAAFEAHHRLTRRFGPDCACNALALCSTCHHEEVHGKPATARDLGQIVSRHASTLPGQVPVWVHGPGCAVLLDCHGNYLHAGLATAGSGW